MYSCSSYNRATISNGHVLTATPRSYVTWKFSADHVRCHVRDVLSRHSWNYGISYVASARKRSDVAWWQICTMTEWGCSQSRILKKYTTLIAIQRAQNYTVVRLCPWKGRGNENIGKDSFSFTVVAIEVFLKYCTNRQIWPMFVYTQFTILDKQGCRGGTCPPPLPPRPCR